MPDENPVEAGQFLGEDGALQEDWMQHLEESLREDPTLKNSTSIQGLASQVVNAEKKFGRDKIALLTETSTDEERNEHYTKLGRPPSAEGYELSKVESPAGIPKDDKFIAKMGQTLFEGGASKALAQKLVQGYMEYTVDLAKSMDTEDKLANAEANKQLHTILGSAYDTKMASANVAIEALARPIDNDFAETLKKELPYDAMAAQMMIKIGDMIGEDKGLKGTPAQGDFTPADAMAKINEIMKDPYYVTDRPQAKDDKGNFLKPANKEYHDQLVEQVKGLFEIRNA